MNSSKDETPNSVWPKVVMGIAEHMVSKITMVITSNGIQTTGMEGMSFGDFCLVGCWVSLCLVCCFAGWLVGCSLLCMIWERGTRLGNARRNYRPVSPCPFHTNHLSTHQRTASVGTYGNIIYWEIVYLVSEKENCNSQEEHWTSGKGCLGT